MTRTSELTLDLLIVGGGAAGMWLLDEAVRRGRSALLLERHALGSGQTIASQGIIHGGLKYTLSNLIDPGAKAIAHMPPLWRDCLAGRTAPDLSATALRSDFCHLWQSGSARSRLGLTGARALLRVKPVELPHDQWPDVLRDACGCVYRLDEQVLEPGSFIACLAQRHAQRLVQITRDDALEWNLAGPGQVQSVKLLDGDLTLRPSAVVLTAGAGNGALRQQLQLDPALMQRRPLHMVVVRGPLPTLNGHCTDFSQTRFTITTAVPSANAADALTTWQVGGQISEAGVQMDERTLLRHTRDELLAVLPRLDLSSAQWMTYRVDRAEQVTQGGLRPAGVTLRQEGNVITAWPTKLALAPQLASDVLALLPATSAGDADLPALHELPRPPVAPTPWENHTAWISDL